jgi:hypothetical protein
MDSFARKILQKMALPSLCRRYKGEDDKGERFVTVLEIPPVTSAMTAVQASILADLKKK